MTLTTHPLDPIGAEVSDLRVDALDPDGAAELAALLAEHGVLMLRDQHDVDDDAFLAFLRSLGPMAFTAGEAPLEGYPDLNLISNVGRETPPRSQFHVDTSYVAEPPAYTALRAVVVPEQGGQTVFSNQFRAWDTLTDELRADLAPRTVRHVVTGVEPGPGEETAYEHPLARPHPVTGRPALYLSTPQRCAAISGMDDERAAETVRELIAHSTREDNVHRHTWRSGDVVIWDNGAVMHRADHSGVLGDRVMHRGMVGRYPSARR